MDIVLTMNACGGSSDSQKVYYGKTKVVTGTPLSGTGWVLHTGAPLAASATTTTIVALDDNVEYTINRYCNCPVSGDNGPEVAGPFIKYACPSLTSSVAGSTTVNYNISIPTSASNSGTWIERIKVQLLDSAGVTVLQTNIIPGPFSSAASGSFSGLTENTAYKLRILYSKNDDSKNHTCSTSNITTQAACTSPTVSLINIASTSMQVAWTVPATFAGDTYNIVVNGNTLVSGVGINASPYTLAGLTPNTLYNVQVVRNCGFGDSSTGSASATTPATYNVNVSSSMGEAVISAITGIPGFSLSSTLEAGETVTGNHTAFSGTIVFNVSNAPTVIAGNAILRKNGVTLQCINIAQSFTGNASFSSQTFTAADLIEIRFNTGSCA